MGQVKGVRLSKKEKAILASRELIDDALDLDKRLAGLKDSLAQFEKDMDPFKDQDQKKIRDF